MKYSGVDLTTLSVDVPKITTTAGFYAGNIIEHKALSLLRIPQMAGQKKILALAGQYLPEGQAVADLFAGSGLAPAGEAYGQRSIGYSMNTHDSFITNPTLRTRFLRTLGARLVLGGVSRFVGPMINPMLPKGLKL